MKHLNDFKFADIEYSTYRDSEGVIVDIKDANGELIHGKQYFDTEEQAVEYAENYIINNLT